ncbi:sodium channel modifier 1-like isoform X2 [Coturnix japonica]|uniref:sodium channel modifier 1-like isoform X2 n=1 Tax=Coturnix japonica TaxID=93934 RepID=UPI000777DC28|nr:sodium channel modifier 1-like isoform X2 [Coturnix japonica]
MSFKRDGDDAGQLAVLQRRRVSELLANYIPEDEALLLRSGRYACTVCPHRPVFDTLEVLAVHRTGRKHVGSLRRCYGGSRTQEATVREQQCQEAAVGAEGSPAPLLLRTKRIAQSALLKAAPYNSCCRRTGVNGSGVRAGRTRMGPSAAPTAMKEHRDAVEATAAVVLPRHCGGRGEAAVDSTHTQQGGPRGARPSPPPSQPTTISPTRRQELQRYLQLRSAGWIQDPSGKWVKDENAEFDSDEDEPPLLPPT